jgi:hypothetical protein
MKTSIFEKAWSYIRGAADSKIIKFILPKSKCQTCGVKDAKWRHSYLFHYACDDCVPRGCSCRILKNSKRAAFLIQYEYKKDKRGKEYPCEDWDRF